MAHDVFISYSSHDKPIADAVCAALESQRIRCWIAPRDVVPGVPYGEAIIEAISASRVLVLLFSSNSNQSPQVMREVERAVSKGIAILPFRIEDVKLCKEMEYYISTPHWLDALTDPMEQHLERLAATAAMLLEREREEDAVLAGTAARAGATTTAGGRPSTAPSAASAREAPGPRFGSLETGSVATLAPPAAVYSPPAPGMALDQQPEGAAAAPAMATGNAFLRRMASAAIDGLILYVLWIVGLASLFAVQGGRPSGDGVSQVASNHLLAWGIFIGIAAVYGGGMLAARGQTLGKMALGLRVAGPDGGRPIWWRAVLRETIGKLISGYVLCLGYVWMLWDREQQTWHDKIAQTHVEPAR